MNNIELVNFVKSKIGTPYVYGTKGEVLTLEKYNNLKKLYGDLVWDSDKEKIGKTCCDCSGLISWYTKNVKSSTNYKEEAKEIFPISTIENAPIGVAVWQKGHIGIYVGNKQYVAADGSKYGVRINDISKSNFTNWFRLSEIDYIQEKDYRYNTIDEIPEWAKPTIKYLIDNKKIANTKELDLSYDMLRVLVILNR